VSQKLYFNFIKKKLLFKTEKEKKKKKRNKKGILEAKLLFIASVTCLLSKMLHFQAF
jgi:hypothetical protein